MVGSFWCYMILCCWGAGEPPNYPTWPSEKTAGPQPGTQQGRKVMSPISQIERLRPAVISSFPAWLPLDCIDFGASHFCFQTKKIAL